MKALLLLLGIAVAVQLATSDPVDFTEVGKFH